MPLIKTTFQKNLTLTRLWEIKSQKCGLRGKIFSANGNEYTGEWKDNQKHGQGTQVWKKSGAIYKGEWKFGKRDGYGVFSVLHPETKQYTKYCGEWKDGKKHGYGMYFYNKAEVYEGEWSENHREGWGRMHYENGDIYEGEWMKGQHHGYGIIRHANEHWYEGQWRDGKKNGNGKFYYPEKGQSYEGFWVDGVAKCGTLSDFERDEVPTRAKHSIPQLHLVDAELVLKEAKTAHSERINSSSTP